MTANIPKNNTVPFYFLIPKECQECNKNLSTSDERFLTFPSGKIICSSCSSKKESILSYSLSSKCQMCNSQDEKVIHMFPENKTLCKECIKTDFELVIPDIKQCKLCASVDIKELTVVSPIMEVLCLDCSGKAKLEEVFDYSKLKLDSQYSDIHKCAFCENDLTVEYIMALNESINLHKMCRECVLGIGSKLKKDSTKYNKILTESGAIDQVVHNLEHVSTGELALKDMISLGIKDMAPLLGVNHEVLNSLSGPNPFKQSDKQVIKQMGDGLFNFVGSMFSNDDPVLGNKIKAMSGEISSLFVDTSNLDDTRPFIDKITDKIASFAIAMKKEKNEDEKEEITDGDEKDSDDSSDEEWY